MQNKEDKFKINDLASDFANLKPSQSNSNSKWSELDGCIALLWIWALFGNDKSQKTNELENRIAKLETKTDLIEKIILK